MRIFCTDIGDIHRSCLLIALSFDFSRVSPPAEGGVTPEEKRKKSRRYSLHVAPYTHSKTSNMPLGTANPGLYPHEQAIDPADAESLLRPTTFTLELKCIIRSTSNQLVTN